MDGELVVKDEPPDDDSVCVGHTNGDDPFFVGNAKDEEKSAAPLALQKYPWLRYEYRTENGTDNLLCWPCSQASANAVKFPVDVSDEELAGHKTKNSHTLAVSLAYCSVETPIAVDASHLRNVDDASSSAGISNSDSSSACSEEDQDQLQGSATRNENQKRKRRFCSHWLLQFPWLMYDETNNKMFCKLCIKYCSGSSSSFVKGGNTSFKVGNIHSHTICKDHQRAMQAEKCADARKTKQEVHLDSKSVFLLDKYLWYFPWLSYKAGANMLTCSICQEHGMNSLFLAMALEDTDHIYQQIKSHSQRKDHLTAEKKEVQSWEEGLDSLQQEEEKPALEPNLEESLNEPVCNGSSDSAGVAKVLHRDIKTEEDMMELTSENVPSQGLKEQPVAEARPDFVPVVTQCLDESPTKTDAGKIIVRPVKMVMSQDELPAVDKTGSPYCSAISRTRYCQLPEQHPKAQMPSCPPEQSMPKRKRCSQLRTNLPVVLPVFGTFQREWLTSFSWLQYDKAANSMKCILCAKHKKKNLLATGTRVFKRSCLAEHAVSVKHCEALRADQENASGGTWGVPAYNSLDSAESTSSEDSSSNSHDDKVAAVAERDRGLVSLPSGNWQCTPQQLEPNVITIQPCDDDDDIECFEQSQMEESSRNKKRRKFLPTWQEDRSWLRYDPVANLMYCEWCKEIGSSGPFSQGTNNFHLSSISHHSQSQTHQRARQCLEWKFGNGDADGIAANSKQFNTFIYTVNPYIQE